MPSFKTLNHPDYQAVNVKANREVKTYPLSSDKVWCGGCDRSLIHLGEKCSECGFQYKTKRRKK